MTNKKNFIASKTAVNFLTSLPKSKKKYDLVCIGPLTNIATALHILGPDNHDVFWNCINHLIIMGGAVCVPGNVTPFAEFNFFADPIAARIVFEAWEKRNDKGKKLYLVPLDVTEQFGLRWEDIKPENKNGQLAYKSHLHKFVTCMLQKYFFFHGIHASPVYWEYQHKDIIWDSFKLEIKEKDRIRVPVKLRDEYRRKIAKLYGEKKIGGGSGVKNLSRFCYLHDPLAMYVNFNIDNLQNCFLKERIRIVMGLGETRGISVKVTERSRPIEALINDPTLNVEGTFVNLLDYKLFRSFNENKFIDSLVEAIKNGGQ